MTCTIAKLQNKLNISTFFLNNFKKFPNQIVLNWWIQIVSCKQLHIKLIVYNPWIHNLKQDMDVNKCFYKDWWKRKIKYIILIYSKPIIIFCSIFKDYTNCGKSLIMHFNIIATNNFFMLVTCLGLLKWKWSLCQGMILFSSKFEHQAASSSMHFITSRHHLAYNLNNRRHY